MQGLRMDRLYAFLEDVRQRGYARENFLGFLNVIIGRRIERPIGTIVSTGLTWRTLARVLKKLRWDTGAVRELGIEPKTLPPRDRIRFWYAAISLAQVDSEKADKAGDRLARSLEANQYVISPGPD
jgi:hypothetical protein